MAEGSLVAKEFTVRVETRDNDRGIWVTQPVVGYGYEPGLVAVVDAAQELVAKYQFNGDVREEGALDVVEPFCNLPLYFAIKQRGSALAAVL